MASRIRLVRPRADDIDSHQLARRGDSDEPMAPAPRPDDESWEPQAAPRSADMSEPAEDQPASRDVETEDVPSDEDPKIAPRHLRKARRRATKMGLNPASDLEAYRMLLDRGIDVAASDASMLDQADGAESVQLPSRIEPAEPVPFGVPLPLTDEERAREIAKIQRDLVNRRRRRLALLTVKLLFFVALPTFITGWYYYTIATDMYAVDSQVTVDKSDNVGGPGGGLLGGLTQAGAQDSIAVQDFLTSREALQRLDADSGWIAHFQHPSIDDLQRLPPDASFDRAYSLYRKLVTVGYDSSEGHLRITVVARTPEDGREFSLRLIDYAEERVDQMSVAARESVMAGATGAYDRAELRLAEQQGEVLRLQEELGVVDPQQEIAAQLSIIATLENEMEQDRLDLAQILANPRPNQTQVAVLEDKISRVEARIAELRQRLVEASDRNQSLARTQSQLNIAQAELEMRMVLVQETLSQMEAARTEADRQVRFLSIAVNPIPPDRPTYPRKFENTVLAGIIFMAIYILVSLTVSILREQVSV